MQNLQVFWKYRIQFRKPGQEPMAVVKSLQGLFCWMALFNYLLNTSVKSID